MARVYRVAERPWELEADAEPGLPAFANDLHDVDVVDSEVGERSCGDQESKSFSDLIDDPRKIYLYLRNMKNMIESANAVKIENNEDRMAEAMMAVLRPNLSETNPDTKTPANFPTMKTTLLNVINHSRSHTKSNLNKYPLFFVKMNGLNSYISDHGWVEFA